MAREQSPAFQFYPQDFLSDDKVMAMNAAARGVYIVLLCHCWLNHELPNDPKVIRRLGLYDGKGWPVIWGMIRECLFLKDGKYIQPRIERERDKQAKFRSIKASAGQAGGKQRASNALAATLAKASSSSLVQEQEEQEQSTVAPRLPAAVNGNNGHRTPRGNQRVIVRLIHTILDDPKHPSGFTDLLDVAKEACAQKHIAYNSSIVGAALESAIAQRASRAS